MMFSELEMLNLLDLGENQLSLLPASLGYLVNLQTLNLREATVLSSNSIFHIQCFGSVLVSIRIRNRIQLLKSIQIQIWIQAFSWPTLNKEICFIHSFRHKLLFRPLLRTLMHTAHYKYCQTFWKTEIYSFIHVWEPILALLDPDPYFQYWSGSGYRQTNQYRSAWIGFGSEAVHIHNLSTRIRIWLSILTKASKEKFRFLNGFYLDGRLVWRLSKQRVWNLSSNAWLDMNGFLKVWKIKTLSTIMYGKPFLI